MMEHASASRNDDGESSPENVVRGRDLVHGSCRCHVLHDVSSSSVGSYRKPSSNNLAQRRQIRLDAKVLLCASMGNSAWLQGTLTATLLLE